jgi:hypothetical protein
MTARLVARPLPRCVAFEVVDETDRSVVGRVDRLEFQWRFRHAKGELWSDNLFSLLDWIGARPG